MRVFISWSGETSRRVAEALRTWLGDVIHFIDPWVSSQDIYKGGHWAAEVSEQLEASRFGILCLTKENLFAPWILFEAGVLARTLDRGCVCPYALDVRPADITGPLAQFQCAVADRQNTLALVESLNAALESEALPESKLHRAFDRCWPELERQLKDISAAPPDSRPPVRAERELLEEILNIVRVQARSYPSTGEYDLVPKLRQFILGSTADDGDLNRLSEAITLTSDNKDPNATDWPSSTAFRPPHEIDGTWVGRWTSEPSTLKWYVGQAMVAQRRNRVYIFFDDGKSVSLILATRSKSGRLMGRYINLPFPHDSTAWVGQIVDNDRIDGIWANGRWDFRRVRTVSKESAKDAQESEHDQ